MSSAVVMGERPLLYDLFCKAGGCTKGYMDAGFRVIGVDIEPQPHHCGDGFLQMDAFEFFARYEVGEFELAAAFHASPPCQGYSIMRNLPWLRGKDYPLLIEPVRQCLIHTGLPYVIENVAGARYRAALPEGLKAGWLCGTMFGLPFYRHRYFETPFYWPQPGHPKHTRRIRSGHSLMGRARDVVFEGTAVADDFATWPGRRTNTMQGHAPKARRAALAMGVPWMSGDEATQAIPPVMTSYVGGYLMAAILAQREVSR